MQKLTAGIIGAVMVLSAFAAFGSAGTAPLGATADDAWKDKLDPELRAFLEEGILPGNAPESLKGADRITVWVRGPSLPVPDMTPATREGWTQYWATKAMPTQMGLARADAQLPDVEVKSFYPAANAGFVKIPADLVEQLASQDFVVAMGLDYEGAVQSYDTTGEYDTIGIQNVNEVPLTQAPTLHAEGVRGAGALIAGIDTGIDDDHPAMRTADGVSRVVHWKAYVGCSASPCDDHGHGTHTAGTFGGSDHSGNQEPGMAPDADIMGIKFLNSGGSGTFENGLASLQYAFDNGADLSSNSWGGGSCPSGTGGPSGICDLVNQHALAGMIHVISAGNSGCGSNSVGAPGGATLAFTSAATDLNMNRASFSSCGPAVDFSTVGVNVRSAIPGGGYTTMSGTSMSAPGLSGGIALLVGAMHDLVGRDFAPPTAIAEGSEGELHDLLAAHTIDLGSAGWDSSYGHGFLQLEGPYQWILGQAAALVNMKVESTLNELGAGETNVINVNVENVRVIETRGSIAWELGFNGDTIDSGSAPLTLAGGESHTFSYDFESGMKKPGVYTFRATYSYEWTKYTGETFTETITAADDFMIVRPDVIGTFDLPSNVAPGDTFSATLTMGNIGNAVAEDVTVRVTVPAGTTLAMDPSGGRVNAYHWMGAPAPERVFVDVFSGETLLVYDAFDLAPGGATAITYSLTAVAPGEGTHVASTTWGDARGYEYAEEFSKTVVTGL